MIILFLALIFHAGAAEPSALYYQKQFPLKNVYDKLTDNHGNGDERLYGTRNFRAVLSGVIYRGGANNHHNKYGPRDLRNPLPKVGLDNLCKQGFSTAVYLYPENFSKAPKTVVCKNIFGQKQTLHYLQKTPQRNKEDAKFVLQLIHKRLESSEDQQPIYLQCWNGWHASGYISALALRQFCDFTTDQAVAYWNKNTDGHIKGAHCEHLRQRIRAFELDPKLKLDPKIKARVCPQKKT